MQAIIYMDGLHVCVALAVSQCQRTLELNGALGGIAVAASADDNEADGKIGSEVLLIVNGTAH